MIENQTMELVSLEKENEQLKMNLNQQYTSVIQAD